MGIIVGKVMIYIKSCRSAVNIFCIVLIRFVWFSDSAGDTVFKVNMQQLSVFM